MTNRITAGTIAVLIALGGVALVAPAAHATDEAPVCVPSEGAPGYWIDVPDTIVPAVGTPTIVIDNPDYVPGTEASTVWYNFSPNQYQGPLEGAPTFPNDERGTWQGPHTEGGPGQDQSGVYQQGNGHGSWFYRENTPATPPVGEPTIEVTNPDYVPERIEVTPDTWVDPIEPVTCPPVEEEPPTEEPPVVVPPIVTPPVTPEVPAPAPVPVALKTVPVADTLAVTGAEDVNWLLPVGAIALIGAGAWALRRQTSTI